jgi:hypothetical protein
MKKRKRSDNRAFDLTKAAEEKNAENLLVIHNAKLAEG